MKKTFLSIILIFVVFSDCKKKDDKLLYIIDDNKKIELVFDGDEKFIKYNKKHRRSLFYMVLIYASCALLELVYLLG